MLCQDLRNKIEISLRSEALFPNSYAYKTPPRGNNILLRNY